ncbi:MAG: BrnT family toxin [Pseudomonadota bacterium]
MRTTYDPVKRLRTIAERGLDMAEAGAVFDGDHITFADDRRVYGEPRFITVGFLRRRMVLVAWTPREASRRIISMRKANEREQKAYGTRFA